MTRRVPELDRALPEALLNMNPDDCKKLGIQDGDMVKVKSTYGEFDIKVSTAGRTEPPAGVTFAPFFAEETPGEPGGAGRVLPAVQGTRLQEDLRIHYEALRGRR